MCSGEVPTAPNEPARVDFVTIGPAQVRPECRKDTRRWHHRDVADESGEPQQQSGAQAREHAVRDEHVVRKQRRAVFRVPPVSLLTIPILLFCITPVAFSVPGLQLLYVIPVAVIAWVLRVRTTATPEGLTARTPTATRFIPWDELSGLSVTEKAAVRAALTDGTTVVLPYVRLHHVPVLSLLSNGRVPDPSGVLAGDGDSTAVSVPDTGSDSGKPGGPESSEGESRDTAVPDTAAASRTGAVSGAATVTEHTDKSEQSANPA